MKLVVVAIVLAAASAHADPMSAEARAHFDRGRAYYEAGAYTEAIAELSAGQQLEPHGDFLYALGQAYRKLGDCAHAIESYRAFLATQPPEKEAARVRANIARCPVTVQPSEPAPEPEPAPVVPPPPPVAPPPPPPRAPRVVDVPPPQRPFYADAAGDVLAAGGLAGLGAGITYLILGDRDARAANAAPTVARLQQLSATAGRERTIGATCVIAGGALAAGAVVRYVLASRREPALSVALTSGSISAVWSGRF